MREPESALCKGTRRARLGVKLLAVMVLAVLVAPHPLIPLQAALAEESGSTESSASALAPLPTRMASTRGAQQLIIATGRRIGSTSGTLQFFDYADGSWLCTMSVPCRFGKRGLMNGAHRWAGNKTTPTGIWAMPGFMFGTHKRAPVGTTLRYRRVTSKSWWSSRKGSTYNRWIEARRWRGERLANARVEYEYAVSTGYNTQPNKVVYGRGTGIFLHMYGRGLASGCISISRSNMIRVAKLLDPGKRPAFAVGTLATGTPTSILSY